MQLEEVSESSSRDALIAVVPSFLLLLFLGEVILSSLFFSCPSMSLMSFLLLFVFDLLFLEASFPTGTHEAHLSAAATLLGPLLLLSLFLLLLLLL